MIDINIVLWFRLLLDWGNYRKA